jgi:transposase
MESDRSGNSASIVYPLIGTTKLNNIAPQPWLIDVFSRIADQKIDRIDELLPRRYSQDI